MTDVSLWLTTEGGTTHRSCGNCERSRFVGERFVRARVASAYELGPCCRSEDIACAFDVFSEPHDYDQQVILSLALARAEGRDIGQPWRCDVHGILTFGGCCD